MSLRHHQTWILSQIKLGTTELEFGSYAKKLVKRLDPVDRRAVRFAEKLTPWIALIRFELEFFKTAGSR